MTYKAIPFIYKRGYALSSEDDSSTALELDNSIALELDSSTALELDSYIVYTLSTADKLGHTEHTLQYLAHV